MRNSVEVIINGSSGRITNESTRRIGQLFDEHEVDAAIHVARDGDALEALANQAATSDASIIVAGGGDGTVSAVASAVIGSGKTLGVLPLGTLNNFSRDLGIPQDLSEAVGLIADNHAAEIDIAEVNGRAFINNSSIGIYPRIVLNRERQQRLGKGKWWAAAWAAWRVLRISPFYRIRLEIDGAEFRRKTPFVFVGNNAYEMDLYNIGRRLHLNEGELSVYVLHRGGRVGLLLLALRTLFGRLRQAKDFEEIRTTHLNIEMRRESVLVAVDGEISIMTSPLEYRIRPKALRVIVPDTR
jgi:YegS/Rv2252/BmrU family lipid kinase